VKVGDLVKLIGSFAGVGSGGGIAMIISSSEFSPGWHTLLFEDEVIQWAESQLEVINESR
jgi:hypothetical protein